MLIKYSLDFSGPENRRFYNRRKFLFSNNNISNVCFF